MYPWRVETVYVMYEGDTITVAEFCLLLRFGIYKDTCTFAIDSSTYARVVSYLKCLRFIPRSLLHIPFTIR